MQSFSVQTRHVPMLQCQIRMLLYKRLSCMLGSPRDPDVLIGQGEI